MAQAPVNNHQIIDQFLSAVITVRLSDFIFIKYIIHFGNHVCQFDPIGFFLIAPNVYFSSDTAAVLLNGLSQFIRHMDDVRTEAEMPHELNHNPLIFTQSELALHQQRLPRYI